MMVKVSIIMTAYNVEEYIRKCLDSLVEQKLKDIEIIVVNDCSPDDSQQIIDEFAKKDNRIKIVNHKVNRGLAEARNSGLKIAKGEFVGFVDSDDWIDKNMFEKMYNKAKRTGADIVECNIHYIRDGVEVDGGDEAPRIRDRKDLIRRYITNDRAMLRNCWNKIYSSSLLKKNKIVFPLMRNAQDGFFNLKAIYYSNKISYINEKLYYYVWNENAITKVFNDHNITNTYMEIGLFEKFLEAKNILHEVDFESYHITSLFGIINKEIRCNGGIYKTMNVIKDLRKLYDTEKSCFSRRDSVGLFLMRIPKLYSFIYVLYRKILRKNEN